MNYKRKASIRINKYIAEFSDLLTKDIMIIKI